MGVRRVVRVSVLPGQPTDGSGKVCIHLFVRDEKGINVEPHALHPLYENGERVKGKVEAKPTRGRLACNPNKRITPVVRNGVTIVTHRTEEASAVSCPKCKQTKEYLALVNGATN